MSTTKDTDQILGNEYDTLAHIDAITDATGNSVGPILNDGYTDDLQPVLSGRLPMGEGQTLRVYANGVVLGYADIKEGGYWTFQPDTPLEPGKTYDFQVFLLDSGTSVLLPSNTFTIHTTELNHDVVPTAPTITNVVDNEGSQKGNVAQNAKTDDSQPEVSGNAEAHSVVTVSVTSPKGITSVLGSVVADDNGHWSYQLDNAQSITTTFGEWTFSAVASNEVGDSAASNKYSVETVAHNADDFTPPDAPLIDSFTDNVGVHKGNFASGHVTDDNTPTLNGHAEADSVVKIYEGTTLIGSTTANVDGVWSFTPTVNIDGKHTYTATATDPAGNVSKSSASFVIDVDTIAQPPVITDFVDNSGVTQGTFHDYARSDDQTPTFHGTAEANSLVHLWARGPNWGLVSMGKVRADENGHWTLTPTFSSTAKTGTWTFYATAVDSAGNSSSQSSRFHLIHVAENREDTTPPDVPTINDVHDGAKVIESGVFTQDKTPTLAGQAEANSIVKIYDGSTLIGSVAADASGKWNFTPAALNDGAHTLIATATDASGNTSGKTPGFVINVDTHNDVPVVIGMQDDYGMYTGIVKNGGSTDISRAHSTVITGTAEADSIVHFYRDGPQKNISYSVQADHEGNWTLDQRLSWNGYYAYDVWSVDQAGNTSGKTHYSVHRVGKNLDSTGHIANVNLEHAEVNAVHEPTQDSQIDQHNGASGTLILTMEDILSEAHVNLFVQDGKQQLAVTGDQGDVVELKVDDIAHAEWHDTGAVTTGGIQYEVYQHASSDVELLVQHGLELHQVS
ncbi:Ig-like protein group 3 [Scandinavium goeteborgense]|uniref:Ig-like protein group 3 n=2 Tax=Scandinavium goeteborgense TaxID=1851514 RepID=A0A4R6DPE8_SCAGO|nr:Ig-like protein group 3 [Scandinavium goeteborgense]